MDREDRTVCMSVRDSLRAGVCGQLIDGTLSERGAADRLALSVRQVRRLKRRHIWWHSMHFRPSFGLRSMHLLYYVHMPPVCVRKVTRNPGQSSRAAHGTDAGPWPAGPSGNGGRPRSPRSRPRSRPRRRLFRGQGRRRGRSLRRSRSSAPRFPTFGGSAARSIISCLHERTGVKWCDSCVHSERSACSQTSFL